jgi:uncharacterized protein involved in type VI secretion and phage assembly
MPVELEDLVVQIAERQNSRHYGKYRGIVTDISDPDTLCRIKATVPAVYQDETSPWAMPSFPFAGPQHGFVALPEVGDGVWIEFEGGDISFPIWTGCWWGANQVPSPQGEKIRMLATSAGHQVLIDEDANEIKLVHPGGAEISLTDSAISLKLGSCELKISSTDIDLNNGMVKVTTTGASVVNDAIKFGV